MMGQKFAVYDEARRVRAFYDADLCDPPEGSQFVPLTDDEHVMLVNACHQGRPVTIDESGKPTIGEAPTQ